MTREKCNTCLRPVKMCFCRDIIKQNNKTQLLIIQDDEESRHYLNTAIMAKLSFENTTLELVSKLKIEDLTLRIKNASCPAILYPSLENSIQTEKRNQVDLLIVLDGTWRKAKRILHTFSILKELPFVSLTMSKEKKYSLRKAKLDYQYSTLEAITYALASIESKDFASALILLDKQIQKQKRFIPLKKE